MSNVPRIRTVPQAVAELKALDPDTAVTLRAVRRLINSGQIVPFMVGNKRLIDMDKLIDVISNPQPEPIPPAAVGQFVPSYETNLHQQNYANFPKRKNVSGGV